MPSSPVRFAVVLGLASSLLLLSGCSKDEPAADAASPAPSATPTSATPSASPTPTPKPKQVKASDNFDKVTVSGGFGETPKVKVESPWAIDQTRTKVLESSKGPVVGEGQSVEVNYYGVNGRTGKKFDESFTNGTAGCLQLGAGRSWIQQRTRWAAPGQPCADCHAGKDGYDPMGGNPQAGIEVGDTLIFVVDLVDVQLAGPEGSAVQRRGFRQ